MNESDPPRVQADNSSIAIGEINISGTVTGDIRIGRTIIQPADARLRHDLSILLKNVKTTWIQERLEKSLHEAALLNLGMELRTEVVDNPWRMVMEKPDQSQQAVPRDKRIKDVFEEANRLLLILGEPGAGKTTTLLQLARDLTAEVDQTFTQPIPVIFILSTWTNKQPLDEWLIAELNSKYFVPKKQGRTWLEDRRILPLLDGLDEVSVENRTACVQAINKLIVDYGIQGLVVCSRVQDYMNLNARLAFYRAIYLRPLSPEQVDEYLQQAGAPLANLRDTLEQDEELRSMAQSPLILNIMSLAYMNTSAAALRDPTFHTELARRRHLFDTYITRMLHRKGVAPQFELAQVQYHLSWLAHNMVRQKQDIFLIEGLQPAWLMTRASQWMYILASRLGSVMASWLLGAVILGLVIDTYFWPIAVSVTAIVTGILVGVVDALRYEWLRGRTGKTRSSGWSVFYFFIIWVSVSLCVWLGLGLTYGLITPETWQTGFELALDFGTFAGLMAVLMFALRGSQRDLESDIQTVEALTWSWRQAGIGGCIGWLIGSAFIFLMAVVISGMDSDGWRGVAAAAVMGLVGGILGLVINGMRRKIVETRSRPNQGIRLWVRNAIIGGLIVGTSIGAAMVFLVAPFFGLDQGLEAGQVVGFIFALLGALRYGALDFMQHYTLRLLLHVQGGIPRNYTRFLDYAVDRIFLQKVGGGYRFVHRLLLEHFAEMYPEKSKH